MARHMSLVDVHTSNELGIKKKNDEAGGKDQENELP